MKRKTNIGILRIVIVGLLLFSTGAVLAQSPAPGAGGKRGAREPKPPKDGGRGYSIEQAVSDKAQLHTIAFNGLAFMTGTLGADTFLPPGKVADFFGFQYMRDIDISEAGHNMNFLTNIANNMLAILSAEQKALLVGLAREQEPLYKELALLRLPLIEAFRRNLEGNAPAGSGGLSAEAVERHVGDIFAIDGLLSFRRAEVYGEVVGSLTPEQTAAISRLLFNDSSTWPPLPQQLDKRSLSHTQNVAVMTYASELFSWYAGSIEADVYFCPERHGTYFGGFYMKDYPAMGNPDYFIPTALTGESGETFLDILESDQRALITGIIDLQRPALAEIVAIRRQVAEELRRFLDGRMVEKETVLELSRRYGELDGELSHLYASRFAAVYKTLSSGQKAALVELRNQNVFPEGAYIYSDSVAMPEIPDSGFLFAR